VKNKNKAPIQTPIAMLIAIISGITMLAMYIWPIPNIQTTILNWATIMAAAALVIGVFNLLSVHGKRVIEGKGIVNSFALVITLIVAFLIKYIDPDYLPAEWLLSNLIVPIESALMGVLVISLTYTAVRLISKRPNIYSAIFIITVIFTLASSTALGLSLLGNVKPFVTQVLAAAGARGILIGVALGTITTGLRILMGFDRPYGG
jgi:hypothetical protein